MKVSIVFAALMSVATAGREPAAMLKVRQEEDVDSNEQSLARVSALQALETALPQSLINLAVTNSPAASRAIASEFAGGPPSWFGNLPSQYQSYFIPPVTVEQAPDAIVAAFPTGSTVVQDAGYAAMTSSTAPRPSRAPTMPYGTIGTRSGVAGGGTAATAYSRSLTGSAFGTPTAFRTPTTSSRPSTGRSTTAESTESAGNTAQNQAGTATASGIGSTGPTAAVGMGLVGVLGVAGVLAL
ncbi:MAG: hypothetical protein M1831_005810 [Alyxoria varia]|nr:MAG: hypothetical protein M1831_005810 [Alyxoria varia]